MRNFLLKFLDATKVDEIENAFKEKNPDSNGLPTYISKTRLDEEISKRKSAEEASAGVPKDWKEQLQALKDAMAAQKTDYEEQLAEANKSADVAAKIYGFGARNYKAVRALIDTTSDKPIEEQLKALKESDPYLFTRGGSPKGTGKEDGGEDDKGKDTEKLSTADMYRAVGLTPPVK